MRADGFAAHLVRALARDEAPFVPATPRPTRGFLQDLAAALGRADRAAGAHAPAAGPNGTGLGTDLPGRDFTDAAPADSDVDMAWKPPRARPRRGLRLAALGSVVAVVLVIGGFSVTVALLTGDERAGREPVGEPTSATVPTSPAVPSRSAAVPSRSATARSTSSANAAAELARAGDCLVNGGSAEKPDLRKVACAANTYEVLRRIDATSDPRRCEGTPQWTDTYLYDDAADANDFVLCLRRRR